MPLRPVEGANGSTPGEPWVGDRLTGACCGQGLAGRAARHSLTRNGPPAPGPAAEAQGVRRIRPAFERGVDVPSWTDVLLGTAWTGRPILAQVLAAE